MSVWESLVLSERQWSIACSHQQEVCMTCRTLIWISVYSEPINITCFRHKQKALMLGVAIEKPLEVWHMLDEATGVGKG